MQSANHHSALQTHYGENSMLPVTLESIREEDPRLAAIIKLGDANRQNLGFLPFAGFHDAAAKGHLIAAYRNENLVGYCLFDLPDRTIRLAHLCIAAQARNSGVARKLVAELSSLYPDRLGIRLKCRPDWDADQMWPHLGFTPINQVPGRSKSGSVLTRWWRAHDVPNLFTEFAKSSDTVSVAIDNDVFNDLDGSTRRNGSEFSQAILAPAAAGDIEIVVLSGVRVEAYRTSDDEKRKRLLHLASSYGERTIDPDIVRRTRDHLLSKVDASATAADPSLLNDAANIAEAAIANMDVFVTRDDNMLRVLAPVAMSEVGLEIVHACEALNYLDARTNGTSYLPARLSSTSYTVRRMLSSDHADLDHLLDQSGGEQIRRLRQRVRDVAGRAADSLNRHVLEDANGTISAMWSSCSQAATNRLDVDLIRVARGPLRGTIARQILHMLRNIAIADGATGILVNDSHGFGGLESLVAAEGFNRASPTSWFAPVVDVVGPWELVRTHTSVVQLDEAQVDAPNAEQISSLERKWWPAKVLNPDLPSYLIPIRHQFAVSLFGHLDTLFLRDDHLGLSREHVYYKGTRNLPSAPSRALWYSSGSEKRLIASSRITEVVIDKPRVLHQRFARLGVWAREDIENVKDSKGRACALLFQDTEIFQSPIPLDELRAALGKSRQFSVQSRVKITPEQFGELYGRGRGL